jgi:hypothetical protein
MLNNNFLKYNPHVPHNTGLQCNNPRTASHIPANEPVWLKHIVDKVVVSTETGDDVLKNVLCILYIYQIILHIFCRRSGIIIHHF